MNNIDDSIQYLERGGEQYKILLENCICGCGNKALQNSKYFTSDCKAKYYEQFQTIQESLEEVEKICQH